MTRYHHADWIGPISEADGSNGFGTSDARRQRAVAQGLARHDRGESGPHGALERSAACAPFDGSKTPEFPFEIALQRALDISRRNTLFGHNRSIMQPEQMGHSGFTIGPIEGPKGAGLIGDYQRFADWRCEPVESEAFRRLVGHLAPFNSQGGVR